MRLGAFNGAILGVVLHYLPNAVESGNVPTLIATFVALGASALSLVVSFMNARDDDRADGYE